jgi:hypothetical protein
MDAPPAPVTIAFRIPGRWEHPGELIAALPDGVRLTPESLILPDGTSVHFGAADADDEFPQIFRSSCREATDDELAIVDDYKVNVFLSGPGGSLDAARAMMRAAAAIVSAGGAGVFIDNSGVAHGGQQWLAMTDDAGPDALSYAYVAIFGGKAEVSTMGMHVFGLRDLVMKRADCEQFDIIEVLRYMCASEKPIDDGHVIADLDGPRFRASAVDSDPRFMRGPMQNPFGRLRLVSLREIAETN